jgi:hypothetical protein
VEKIGLELAVSRPSVRPCVRPLHVPDVSSMNIDFGVSQQTEYIVIVWQHFINAYFLAEYSCGSMA